MTYQDPAETVHEWDAGDMGCGELVLLLFQRLKQLRPDDVICLTATDTGAKEDLPAWCSMTGHSLLKAEHPRYWIKKKKG